MSELSCDTPFIGQNETHDLSRSQLMPSSFGFHRIKKYIIYDFFQLTLLPSSQPLHLQLAV